MRIISTVPSQTELLYDLGLSEEVVGITKFCVHPVSWHQTKQRIGGTKNLNIELIKSLQPDLIIANKEENEKTQIESLSEVCEVYVSEVKTLEDNSNLISIIGELVNKQAEAEILNVALNAQIKLLSKNKKIKAVYLIWNNPYMTVGGDTFINDVLKKCGFLNAYADHLRYPEVTIPQIIKLNPDVIFLSSEPFPFKEKHVKELLSQVPNTKVMLVDGEAFSWYGSRILKKVDYLNNLIASMST